ncbi:hypothetical protein HOLleu_33376 [Holothuria leucospilota]|uniref:Uncharacterized protein n=1 Tax=Holothuria leucospilota TaxID=206669 RepID=A0A9Q0YNJ4_HOLLE|nr:hypothetical protein HOLleu_33376 [Holothuria leucospilota]
MANTATYLISGSLTIGGPLLIEHFKEEYGLRKTLILTGAITWHLVLSGVCLTTKNLTTPLEDKSQNEVETHHTKSFLRSHPYLVCLFIFQTFAFIRVLGMPLFLYPFAISKGLSHTQAAILTSMFNFGSMVGRLNALGTFVWKVMTLPLVKVNVITVAPVFFSMMAQILSLRVTSKLVLSLMAITAGISTGFETSWGMSSVMDLSCTEHFKATGSWVLFFSGLGATFGGLIVGSTHDIRGSYDDVMTLIIVLSGLQVIFIVITLTWKRLVKECYLQDKSALYKLDYNAGTCK